MMMMYMMMRMMIFYGDEDGYDVDNIYIITLRNQSNDGLCAFIVHGF